MANKKDEEVKVSDWLAELIKKAAEAMQKDRDKTSTKADPKPGTGSGDKPNTSGGTSL